MATINWPADLRVGTVDYGIEFDVQMSVTRNGRIYTFGLPGARWVATLNFEIELESMQRPAIEALIVSLEGGANRLSMHHFGRPIPNGTLRGNPTLGAPATPGAKTLSLANCNGGVKRGDILGLPGQMFMVLADANPIATNMTVSVAPAIRAAHNTGTPVVWNKPSVLWIPRNSTAGPFPYDKNNVRPPFSIELVEAYS